MLLSSSRGDNPGPFENLNLGLLRVKIVDHVLWDDFLLCHFASFGAYCLKVGGFRQMFCRIGYGLGDGVGIVEAKDLSTFNHGE